MSYYFFAGISITDPEEYQKYLDRADEVFSRFRGTYLAVDTDPELLEGEWVRERAVLIRFDSRDDFEQWYRSEEYQDILRHRLSAADCDSILIRGK